MRTPNLARRPFDNVRPVAVTVIALVAVSLGATAFNLYELARARHTEREFAARLGPLEAKRAALLREVETLNRELSQVPWAKLRGEAGALDKVLVTRGLLWTQLLSDLERAVPWDVRLVAIAPTISETREVTLGITGIATGRQAWLDLLARLFTDASFSEPMPISEEAPGSTNALGYRFQLRVRYWPGGRP